MKAAAGFATVLTHAVAFLGLGSLEVDLEPPPEPPLEITTIELVELPAPTPAVDAVPEPVPEAVPEPEPPAAPPEPEPPTAAPKRPAPKPSPRPRAAPSTPSPAPEPATPPAPTGPAAAPATAGPAAPSAPPGPRKLGQRYSNASPPKGKQRSAAKRCVEPVVKPVPTKRVKAKFPAATLRSDISGDLVLRASVDRTGRVSAVKVVKSPGTSVEGPAKTAFLQWRFEPATACGKPVASTFTKKSTFSGG